MVRDLISATLDRECQCISLSATMDETLRALRSWLFEHVYRAPCVQTEFDKAAHLIEKLYQHFLADEASFLACGGRRRDGDEPHVSVVDFIAGMTDRFALTLYRQLFLPEPWQSL